MKLMTFDIVLKVLKNGHKVARRGWDGRGIFIAMQFPEKHCKITDQYIYIDTRKQQRINPFTKHSVSPWTPTQADLLADDWLTISSTKNHDHL